MHNPNDFLAFVTSSLAARKIFWTYHVNMRLAERSIAREWILASVQTYEIIESYPDDKYLPSCLIRAEHEATVFHILFAIDQENDSVRIVTVYLPTLEKWTTDGRTRRTP